MEREPNVGACEVPDCGQPMRKLTWCASHYAQQLRSGVVKPFSYKWGDGGYRPVHQWLNRTLGAAHTHSCSDCGKPAEEWSYQHNSADEIIDDLGRAYCKDPACYTPRCIPCHRRFDKARRLHVIP